MKHLFAAAAMALLSSCASTPDKPVDEKKLVASGTPADQPAGAGGILRLDPRFDSLVPSGAKIEKVATGFQFTEGPLCLRSPAIFGSAMCRGT